MKKLNRILLGAIVLLSSQAQAAFLSSVNDPLLNGAVIEQFETFAVEATPTLSNGFFGIYESDGETFTRIDDTYDGQFGVTGQSLLSLGESGITINFESTISAFSINIGAADFDWFIEAFDASGTSLGTGTRLHNTNQGFSMGWADSGISSIELYAELTYDTVLFDDMRYVVETQAVPVPAAVWLFISGLIGLFSIKRR